ENPAVCDGLAHLPATSQFDPGWSVVKSGARKRPRLERARDARSITWYYFSAMATMVKVAFNALPRLATTVMIATEMPATISYTQWLSPALILCETLHQYSLCALS